jgi:hypothetical protein
MDLKVVIFLEIWGRFVCLTKFGHNDGLSAFISTSSSNILISKGSPPMKGLRPAPNNPFQIPSLREIVLNTFCRQGSVKFQADVPFF